MGRAMHAGQRRGSPERDGPGKDAGPRAEKAPAIAQVRHGHEDRGRTIPISARGRSNGIRDGGRGSSGGLAPALLLTGVPAPSLTD